MSRKGDCWDNAVSESFFSTLKTEFIQNTVFRTRGQATEGIDDYIRIFYNQKRRHSHNRYLSPVEFELRAQIAAKAA